MPPEDICTVLVLWPPPPERGPLSLLRGITRVVTNLFTSFESFTRRLSFDFARQLYSEGTYFLA